MQEISVGKLYKHFKGNIYKIIALAKCSETERDLIIYQSTKTNDTWVRPYEMWNEIIDDKGTMRFALLN